MPTVRVNAIEVIVGLDLSITYRLTLQIKTEHVNLFPNPKWIMSYIGKNGKVRYMLCHESADRFEVLKVMKAAQVIIADAKISDLQQKKDLLMNQLATEFK